VLKADSPGEMSGEYFRAGLASLGLAPESWLVRRALAWRNRLLLRADAFVAMGAALGEELRAAGVPAGRVTVIPNGVDTQGFRPADDDEKAQLRARRGLVRTPVIVYTGSLVRYKGLPRLLEAWRE
jgi:glycosyltransferase involved in cell wall biosynthesis